jgi:hypothetical protein
MQLRNAIVLGCALLAIPFTASFADDQTTETLHNNYYQDRVVGSCSYPACQVNFAVTQHQTTVITAISCSFVINAGAQILTASLSDNKDNYFSNVPVFINGHDIYNDVYYGINSQIQLFLKQGATPIFYLQTNGNFPSDIVCTISGYHS